MNARKYLKQTVSHAPKTGENDRSEPTFGAPKQRRARKVEEQRAVRSQGGVEIVSGTSVSLDPKDGEVAIGDRIDGLDVQSRESKVDKRGKLILWIAYL